MSSDGSRLFYSNVGPSNFYRHDKGYNIWILDLINEEWKEISNISNSDYIVASLSFDASGDGKTFAVAAFESIIPIGELLAQVLIYHELDDQWIIADSSFQVRKNTRTPELDIELNHIGDKIIIGSPGCQGFYPVPFRNDLAFGNKTESQWTFENLVFTNNGIGLSIDISDDGNTVISSSYFLGCYQEYNRNGSVTFPVFRHSLTRHFQI